jgi:fibronectin-binding autotransporter adhesin
VTGAFTQASGATLNISIGANNPAISAATASLAGNLNIAGYTGAQYRVIRTTGGITGDFANVSIGGASSPVDYLTVTGVKSTDGNDYHIGTSLAWNAGPAKAGGTFTLTGATDSFDVGATLADQAGPFASGWDGKSLTKAGAGRLTLSALNSYTGGTMVSGGTLALSGTGTLGAATGALVVNSGGTLDLGGTSQTVGSLAGTGGSITNGLGAAASLTVNQSGNTSYAGAIGDGAGAVSLVKQGAGTLTLTGAGTYSGGTTIDGGTLRLAGNGAAGTGAIVNHGTLALNRTGAVVWNNAISGNGAVDILSGVNHFTAANSYAGDTRIGGGATLLLGGTTPGGGASGSIVGDVINNGTLAFNRSDTLTYGGAISGGGVVEQNGSGTTILTGAGGAAGAVSVNAGTLEFGQAGVFTAASYTTGDGASTTIRDNARLVVTGAFTQAAGSTLNVGIGTNDPAITAATASLAGNLNIAGYTGAPFGVIRTTDGITGDFANVTIGGASSAVDYLTVTGGKSANGNDYHIGTGLTWNAGAANASGTFTLAGAADAFDVGAALADRAGPFTSGWDGKTLTKAGAGTLTLSALNRYTGGTAVDGGRLVIASTGGVASDVTNKAAFENSGAVTGRVTNAAGATFTQTGGNVSGGVINNGVVNAGGGALDGAIANNAGSFNIGGTLTSNGTFDNAAGATLAVTSSGAYALAGRLTNKGTATIAAGGSLTANGGIANAAGGVITNNGTVTDDLDNAGLYTNNGVQNARVASNSGTIVNSAGATWNGNFATAGTVNNGGTIAGSLTQAAGTTTSNGSITGAVSLLGGLFTGTGSMGSLAVSSGATVAPGAGGSIGVMTVNGNVMFNAGSIYQVAVNAAGQGSSINASGTATINGGTVNVLAGAGNYAPSTQYAILTATGGRNGMFGSVSSNLAFLTPSLRYDANNVYLIMARNDIAFAGIGVTANQKTAGGAVEGLGLGNPIWNAIVQLDAPAARNAFDQLSGEVHASAQTVMIEDSRFLRDAAIDRLRDALGGVGAADIGRVATWARGFGSWGSRDSDGNAARLTRSVGGFIFGVDAPADTWRFGFISGYSKTSFNIRDRATSGTSQNYHLGLYGGAQWGGLALRSGAAYTWHDLSVSRAIAFPGFSDQPSSKANAGTAQIFGELGYAFRPGAVALEPFANLAHVRFSANGFAERGGPAALTGSSATKHTSFATLGMRASANIDLQGINAAAKGMLGWRHAFGDTAPASDLSFASSSAFSITGVPITQDTAVFDAGIDFALSPRAVLGVSYGGQLGSGAADHSFRANFSLKF